MSLTAPVMHDGFPWPIPEALIWDGSDFTVDPSTVCGSGTRYPVAMTYQQMVALYWRAKAFSIAMSAATSDYGVADYSQAFLDTVWGTYPTEPPPNWSTIGDPEDTFIGFPANSIPDDVPQPLVLPVYQPYLGPVGPSSHTGTLYNGPSLFGQMNQAAVAWRIVLFEYGARQAAGDYYPSIELSLLTPPGAGGPLGSISLYSSEEPVP